MNWKKQNVLIFILILVVAIFIGGLVITYVFGGVITLIAFICLVESSPGLRRFITSIALLFDIFLFCLGCYATVNFGITVSMTLLFAGIGYTLIYRPYLYEMAKLDKEEEERNKRK